MAATGFFTAIMDTGKSNMGDWEWFKSNVVVDKEGDRRAEERAMKREEKERKKKEEKRNDKKSGWFGW